MKQLFIGILLLISATALQAQRNPKLSKTREIIVNNGENVIKANVFLNNTSVAGKDSVTYYWYGNNAIHTNVFSYPKNPLHGLYSEFNNDKNLVLQGEFKKGMKHGTWVRWDYSGQLLEKNNYKMGKLCGTSTKIIDGTPRITYYRNNKETRKIFICLCSIPSIKFW